MQNIQKICYDNNIQMLFVSVPTPATWSNERHNGIAKLAEDMNIPYIDMNMPDVEFGFDYALHMADAGYHCNLVGAQLVTKYISNYVNANYTLTDRRNDANYSQWLKFDNDYKEYLKTFEN